MLTLEVTIIHLFLCLFLNFSCKNDVHDIIMRDCSGKRRCEVYVPNREIARGDACGRTLQYLAVRYHCLKGQCHLLLSCLPKATSNHYSLNYALPSSTNCRWSLWAFTFLLKFGRQILELNKENFWMCSECQRFRCALKVSLDIDLEITIPR